MKDEMLKELYPIRRIPLTVQAFEESFSITRKSGNCDYQAVTDENSISQKLPNCDYQVVVTYFLNRKKILFRDLQLTINTPSLKKIKKMAQKILSLKTFGLVLHRLNLKSGTKTADYCRLFLCHTGKISARTASAVAAMPARSSSLDLDNSNLAFLLTV